MSASAGLIGGTALHPVLVERQIKPKNARVQLGLVDGSGFIPVGVTF